MPPRISIDSLSFAYDGRRAVDGVSFSIEPGEIFGLLGPNGAGKSTTVHCVVGLLVPDAGTVTVDGVDVVTNPIEARRRKKPPRTQNGHPTVFVRCLLCRWGGWLLLHRRRDAP